MATDRSAIVCVLSPYDGRKTKCSYAFSGESFSGIQTNDAPVKALISEANRDGHSIETIFCLTSEKARNALEYFHDETKAYKASLCGDNDLSIVCIPYRVDDPEASLAEVIGKLEPYEHVYFDITGGGRDASILMVLAVQFLKMREQSTEIHDIVYSNYSIDQKEIFSQLDTFELGSLRSAVEAFVNYGKADKLVEYFDSKPVLDETTELCNAMTRFSDALALCQVDDVTSLAREVHAAIAQSLEAYGNSREAVNRQLDKSELLLESLLPTIKKRFIPDSDDENEMIISIVRWCVSHQLLQQALCVFIEHVPRCFLRAGFFSVKDNPKSPISQGFRERWLEANLLKGFYKKYIEKQRGKKPKAIKYGPRNKTVDIFAYYCIYPYSEKNKTFRRIKRFAKDYWTINDKRNGVMHSDSSKAAIEREELTRDLVSAVEEAATIIRNSESNWKTYWENERLDDSPNTKEEIVGVANQILFDSAASFYPDHAQIANDPHQQLPQEETSQIPNDARNMPEPIPEKRQEPDVKIFDGFGSKLADLLRPEQRDQLACENK